MKPSKKAGRSPRKPETKSKASPAPETKSKKQAEVKPTTAQRSPSSAQRPPAKRSRKPAPAPEKPSRPRPTPGIPPLLLEGDETATSRESGSGRRYFTGRAGIPRETEEKKRELPESYGTQQIFLTARDPHWLYAYWDLNQRQRQELAKRSSDGRLSLRIHADQLGDSPVAACQLQPDSDSWFVFVGRGNARFLAELGYSDRSGAWQRVAVSRPTLTPPDRASESDAADFVTFPPDVTFDELVDAVKGAVSESEPLMNAVLQLREEGWRDLPVKPGPAREWTPAQARALARVVSLDRARQVWIGSLEITELVRRQLGAGVSSADSPHRAAPSIERGETRAWSSASVARPRSADSEGGFWFKVNAELIVYGATESDARVALAGRPLRLRPDGTFSLRFALPDGDFELPISAESADGARRREAALRFQRRTETSGGVESHPQDPELRAPGRKQA